MLQHHLIVLTIFHRLASYMTFFSFVKPKGTIAQAPASVTTANVCVYISTTLSSNYRTETKCARDCHGGSLIVLEPYTIGRGDPAQDGI